MSCNVLISGGFLAVLTGIEELVVFVLIDVTKLNTTWNFKLGSSYMDSVLVVANGQFHVQPSLQASDDQPEVEVGNWHHQNQEQTDRCQDQFGLAKIEISNLIDSLWEMFDFWSNSYIKSDLDNIKNAI